MNVAQRGLIVLMTATALAATAVPAAHAGAGRSANAIAAVNSCRRAASPQRVSCDAERLTDHASGSTARQGSAQVVTPAALPGGYGPSDLQSAYALPSATAGVGQRVYVVDPYDYANAAADLATYRAEFGLSRCTQASGCFQKLNEAGASAPLPTVPNSDDWNGITALGLDMVSATCPNCSITLIEADSATSTHLMSAVKEATALGAKYVAMSWDGVEDGTELASDATYLKPTGVVYTAPSGDGAYSEGTNYPASSPDVVAVGGTTLRRATNARGWSESAWKTHVGEGSGSGCSRDEAKPSWQSLIAASVCSRRAESDVSAVADPQTGVAVYNSTDGWQVYGGTSVGAPIIAAVYALAGRPAANDQPGAFPYSDPAGLNDVTVGDNGPCTQTLLCTTAVGWDGPTGLGTPNGVAAFTRSGPQPNVVTVDTPGRQSGVTGKTADLQLTGTDSADLPLTFTATGLPTGLSMSSSGLISGTPTVAATNTVVVTATDSTGESGSASFAWAIVGCSGQRIHNPGFESGATSWTATTGVIASDKTHAHKGNGYARLSGSSTTHTETLSQLVTIPRGCKATLTYYLSIASTNTTRLPSDKLVVTANGTSVQTFSNVNRGVGYVVRTVDLSAYAGKKVTIEWTGTEDRALATSFSIDDTALTLS